MPYIPEHIREEIEQADPAWLAPGPLNYRLTRLVDDYLGDHPNYARLAEAVAALECAKLELYRRVAAPMEDYKCHANGDVYRNRSYPPTSTASSASREGMSSSSPGTETAPGPLPSAWGRYGIG